MSPPGLGRIVDNFGGLGSLWLALANLPAPRPEHLDDLGRHGSRDWDADEDEALVNGICQCELRCKTWAIVSMKSLKPDGTLVKHGDAELSLESRESSSPNVSAYQGR